MIHIATVHWATAVWIDIQLRYLHRFIRAPFRVHAFINGFDAVPHVHKFHALYTDDIKSHATKLNHLAAEICRDAAPEDILIFIDSDAFPVSDLGALISDLAAWPLIAVRRDENLGDPQPHPCFCMTTIGFWTAIKGDWERGHSWINDAGTEVTDVGGNLLGILADREIAWKPLLRSNAIDQHPVLFAVYGGAVYHNGAGSRPPVTRTDIANYFAEHPELGSSGHDRATWSQARQHCLARNQDMSSAIYADIAADGDFQRWFRQSGIASPTHSM